MILDHLNIFVAELSQPQQQEIVVNGCEFASIVLDRVGIGGSQGEPSFCALLFWNRRLLFKRDQVLVEERRELLEEFNSVLVRPIC